MSTIDIARSLSQLRPYQVEAFNFFGARVGNLNFDDMGLGKTVVTLLSVANKMPADRSPVLIICPTKAFYVWQDEIKKWLQQESLIYTGTVAKRKKLAEQFNHYEFIITSYGMLTELERFGWDFLICDEIHEAGMLNHKTKCFASIQRYIRNGRLISYYLLTGTPVRQGVVDTFAPLHLVNPETFKSYWQFVGKYCNTITTPFGKEIQRNPKDIAKFREIIRQYMIRRIKSEVLNDLPGKQRQAIPLDMTSLQQTIHLQLRTELMHVEGEVTTVAPNSMVAMLQIREMLVTPRLLGYDEDGAAFNYLSMAGKDLLEQEDPFVIFTPFKKAIPYIEELIKSWGLGTAIYTLSGGITAESFAVNWKGFQENNSGNKVLICVIKSGASFHATVANKCFFLGYEWDFNLNAQAEDRLCRMGQKAFVNCYYLTHNGYTVDEEVRRALNSKQVASNWIVGTDTEYQAMLEKLDKK